MKTTTRFVRVVLLAFLGLWIALMSFYVFIFTRDSFQFEVSFLIPVLSTVFEKNFPNLSSVSIGKIFITWNKSSKKIGVLFVDSILSISGTHFSLKSPNMEFSANGLGDLFESFAEYLLKRFKLKLSSSTVFKLDELIVLLDGNHIIEESDLAENGGIKPSIFVDFYSLFSSFNTSEIILKKIYFQKRNSDALYDLGTFSLNISRKSDMDFLSIKLGSEELGLITCDFTESYRSVLTTKIGLHDIKFNFFEFFDPGVKINEFKNISGYMNSVSNKGNLDSIDVSITSSDMQFLCNSAKPCTLNSAKVSLNYADNVLKNRGSYMVIDDKKIYLNAELVDQNLDLSLKIPSLTREYSCKYWLYSGSARSWFCSNIKGVNFYDLRIHFLFDFSKLKVEEPFRVFGNSKFQDASLNLGDRFHSLQKANGQVYFNENEVNLDFTSGTVRDISINHAKVFVSGDKIVTLSVKGNVNSELLTALKIAGIDPHKINLKSTSKLNGNIDADVDFVVDFYEEDEVFLKKLHVRGDSKDISLSNIFYDGLNLNSVAMEFDLQDNSLLLNLHNKDLKIDVNGTYDDPFILHGIAKGKFAGDQIFTQELMDTIGIKGGDLILDSKFTINESGFNMSADSDIKNLQLKVPVIGWENKVEYDMKLKMQLESSNDNLFLRMLNLSGNNIKVEGKGGVLKGQYVFDFPLVKLSDNDFAIKMKESEKSSFYDVRGKFLDLSNIKFSSSDSENHPPYDEISNNKMSMSHTQEQLISLDVDKVLLKNGVSGEEMKAYIHCINGNCNNSKFDIQFDKDSFLSVYGSDIGIKGYSNNAGLTFKALGILKDIYSGELYLFAQNSKAGRIDGTASITGFKVIGAPILSAVLLVSSLDNIVSTLRGEGIAFNNVTVPFSYVSPVIKIEECWIEGDALGVSTAGFVDLSKGKYIFDGQIIPAYAINKMIWSIPLLGKILTGGSARGMISIDYGIKGDEDDYNLSVNMISILTPTLLKHLLYNIDDIFGSKVTGE